MTIISHKTHSKTFHCVHSMCNIHGFFSARYQSNYGCTFDDIRREYALDFAENSNQQTNWQRMWLLHLALASFISLQKQHNLNAIAETHASFCTNFHVKARRQKKSVDTHPFNFRVVCKKGHCNQMNIGKGKHTVGLKSVFLSRLDYFTL